MKIEYDSAKNERNIAERQLSFDSVSSFDFDTAVFYEDVRNIYRETRFIALGMLNLRLHVLCFTPIVDGIRVISFRKANAREVKRHESQTTD